MTNPSDEAQQEAALASGTDEQTALKARYMMIAEAAYFRAERRGFAPGHVIEDWLEAEAEIERSFGPLTARATDIRQSIRDLIVGDVAGLAAGVHLLAVRSLAIGRLDAEAVKGVVREAIRGAEEGVSQLGERGRDVLPDILAGLERALSDVANASALAVREAHGNAVQFSKEELSTLIAELQALKSLLGDVVNESLANAGEAARATRQGLADHARIQAAQFSQRIDDVMVELGGHALMLARQGKQAGTQVLLEKKGALAGLVSGALRSISERGDHGNNDEKS
jgi:hypothetical protein